MVAEAILSNSIYLFLLHAYDRGIQDPLSFALLCDWKKGEQVAGGKFKKKTPRQVLGI